MPGVIGSVISHRSRPIRVMSFGSHAVKSPMISTRSTPPTRTISVCWLAPASRASNPTTAALDATGTRRFGIGQ
jgi:hypothetical protein